MNKGSILKRFLYLLLAFLILIIIQGPTIYLGVKDASLVSLLVFLLLLKSAGALFLGKRLGLLEGFKTLSSLNAWGMIGLTYLGIYIVTRIGAMVMMMEGVSNSTNQATIENIHMNPFVLITFTVIMAPIVEELVFRGILMGRVFNPDSIVGLILSSLLFGLAHMPNSIGVWIVYAGMGFVLGTVYRKCQKLEYCIMAHMINNSIAVSMMLLLQLLAPYIK
ncbi:MULTISPECIES: CPBP family intramembrane glutamic endopeptidase [Streptococcus]|jgi:CAAX amino terminal protease family protein|uniref:CPBP family intramembrane metalloprotease n=1 Tax=Streptococcus salivarius TaxID=1304 RepID=A0A6A8UE40_STRSL|nr:MULTISPECIES: CPBP family intramembrane glutamic endopeptidase [Streptococcus]MBS5422536.1 CPBP family intramembrane metalloprotease [Streptococcus salivarius]MCY7043448.1 CPBP family intramembrane metalloprotease [Streptococcus vestibularis]MDN5034986.1 CPBP family intramembrane metalloprotease [Streptococcus sp. SS4]MDU3179387.1 CPBP family intramembrane glutamic endopeptidase [Streptococcus vestibularis]MTQ90332.1 CPBP family intramembrane metalloprotease [Streptococcus salivarius]